MPVFLPVLQRRPSRCFEVLASPLHWQVGLLLAFLSTANPLAAASTGRLSIFKHVGYEQSDAGTIRPIRYSYSASLSVSGPATSVPLGEVPVVGPNGVTLRLKRDGTSETFRFAGDVGSLAELDALIPDGRYVIGNAAFFEPVSANTYTVDTAGRGPSLITNFDALQAWFGYGARVEWQPIPDGTVEGTMRLEVRSPDRINSDWSQRGPLDGTATSATLNPLLPMGRLLEATLRFSSASGRQFSVAFPLQVVGAVTLTHAGQPNVPGSTNGNRATAMLSPGYLACDPAGNLYFTESYCVRKISPDGTVTTFAGSAEERGDAEGMGAAARFDNLSGLAVDGFDFLYVTDSYNHKIKKISPAGVVTRLAGPVTTLQPQPGWVDGAADQARFTYPRGLTIDAAGNLYVVDRSNLVRKITPAGVVSTHAGTGENGYADGPVAQAQFSSLSGIVAAQDGTVYVGDSSNRTIRKITPDRIVSSLTEPAGALWNGGDSVGPLRQIEGADFLALDPTGNLYATFWTPGVVRRISPDHKVSTVAGYGVQAYVDGMGSTAAFRQLGPIARAPNGDFYVVDGTTIRRIVMAPDSSTLRITTQLESRTIEAHTTAVYQADAVGSGVRYQWRRNGTPIPGANSPILVLRDVTADGEYTLAVTTGTERAIGNTGYLSVLDGPLTARITNLSIRTKAGAGSDTLIMGFVIAGNGSATKSIFLRGAGPALADYGIGNFLSDPGLVLFREQSLLARNEDWGGSAVLAQAASRLGAFPFSSTSRDAALLQDGLTAGQYSAHITGQTAEGIALAEAYDTATTFSATSARLTNVSARAAVGTGENVLVVGFATEGLTASTILIRAVGPGLERYGVGGVLRDPRLTLYSSGGTIATNNNWDAIGPVAAIAESVGAFPIAAGSADAALLVTLPRGAYTAHVSGVGGTGGVALVEVYEVR